MAQLSKSVVIAGGGLAGLSLAAGLRLRDIPVTVMEAGDYPRHRVCGEFISGTSRGTLDALGIAHLLDDALMHATVSWHCRGVCFFRTRLRQPALGISRHRLDQRLRTHVEALGGTVLTGMRMTPQTNEGTVWAGGKKPSGGQWIGLKVHVRNLPRTTDLEMHLGDNGYTGLAGIEDGWTNVCGLFRMDRSIRGEGRELLAAYLEAGGNRTLAAALREAEFRENSFRAIAGFSMGRQPIQPDVFRIGDANDLIPPFSGNGMSMAFQAAEIAACHLESWHAERISWEHAREATLRDCRAKFRIRMQAAECLHPMLLSSSGRMILHRMGSARLLPFRPMLALVR